MWNICTSNVQIGTSLQPFTSDDTCQELVLPPEIMETYAAAEKHLDNGDLQLSVRPGAESCGFHLIFSKQPDTTTACTDDN